MNSRSIPFDRLPFTDLYRGYINRSPEVMQYFSGHPFSDHAVREHASRFHFPGDRDQSVEALLHFNRQLGAGSQVTAQLERLRDPDSLVVVTGQQLTIYGGPLFTVYKTMTTLLYARRWEELLQRPVVPVFWLADEDHDYPEAAELGLLANDTFEQLSLNNGSGLPVGREILGDSYLVFEEKFFDRLPESDFSDEIRALLTRHYREGATFRSAFGGLLLHLFEKHGLVLAGSDDPEIKSLISRPLRAAADNPEGLSEALESQSLALENAGFGRQALVQPSNLFYIDSDGGRQKLDLEGDTWSNGNGQVWSREELRRAVEANPERFSPNVFLRPMLQDQLLPTLAYVCGPGELAYYAQMKGAYQWAGQQMPMLLPRISGTLVEPAVERVMKKLPFEFEEYESRTEDLETAYLKRSVPEGGGDLFADWRRESTRLAEDAKSRAKEIDPTLEASADKTETRIQQQIDQLQQKVTRAVKRREATQIQRIHRVRENLFPGGKLQERQLSFVYYMNRYGTDLLDRMLEVLGEEVPDSHKVIGL
ncbi:MAG: bacillithiol biosynthesis cysteine-adding enzyme BshC [Balneolaceae bacterium]